MNWMDVRDEDVSVLMLDKHYLSDNKFFTLDFNIFKLRVQLWVYDAALHE